MNTCNLFSQSEVGKWEYISDARISISWPRVIRHNCWTLISIVHARQNLHDQAIFTRPKHISARDVNYRWNKCFSFDNLCLISRFYHGVRKIHSVKKFFSIQNLSIYFLRVLFYSKILMTNYNCEIHIINMHMQNTCYVYHIVWCLKYFLTTQVTSRECRIQRWTSIYPVDYSVAHLAVRAC